jgi:hypothetical protein
MRSAGTMMLGGTIGFGTGSSKTETSGSPVATANGTVDGPKTSNFNLNPTFGFFIQDNLAVGASLNIGTTGNTTKRIYSPTAGGDVADNGQPLVGDQTRYENKTKTTGFGLTLFANKYNEISDKWYWYYGAGLGFGMNSGTTTAIEETAPGSGVFAPKEKDAPKTTNINLGLNMGVTYFLTENWGMQAGLNNLVGLNFTTAKAETVAGPVTTTNTNSNLNLTLGTGNFGVGAVNVGVFYFLR